MCRTPKKLCQKFIKFLIRIFTCIFCCRCKRKSAKIDPHKKNDDKNSNFNQAHQLTSIKIDENLVKQLTSYNNPYMGSGGSVSNPSSLNDLGIIDNQSIATTNTENFDMMDHFSKDVSFSSSPKNRNQQVPNQNQNQDPLVAQVLQNQNNQRRAMTGRGKDSESAGKNSMNPGLDNPDHPINLGYEATLENVKSYVDNVKSGLKTKTKTKAGKQN